MHTIEGPGKLCPWSCQLHPSRISFSPMISGGLSTQGFSEFQPIMGGKQISVAVASGGPFRAAWMALNPQTTVDL